MKIEGIKKHDEGWYIFDIRHKNYGIWFFTDVGEWFLYIQLGKKCYRLSSAGYLKFETSTPAEKNLKISKKI